MKASVLRIALALSLLVNLGVLGAVGYRAMSSANASFPGLARYLDLDAGQQSRWHEAESAFLAQFQQGAREIRVRRDRLIDAIFAEQPDPAAIEAARREIAQLQDEQQRLVVQQLLRERELLDARQRERLAQLLASQPAGETGVERLHRE